MREPIPAAEPVPAPLSPAPMSGGTAFVSPAMPTLAGPWFAGCDVGSTTAKAVVLAGDGQVAAAALLPGLVDPEASARAALAAASARVPDLVGSGPRSGTPPPGETVEPGLDLDSALGRLTRLVGTGYGRNEVPFASENLSEITCHGVGAHALCPAARSLVDTGGQDVKAVALHPDGTVREFAMNDKCAAGTGRFFEAMARTFRCSLEAFSDLSLGAARAIPVSSQCSVFAESEVVSLLAAREPPAEIAAGIQAAVAKRVFALGRRVGLEPALCLTGGCAKNAGLRVALGRILRMEIHPLPLDPQLVGALGAAILARRRAA